jgi:hypothetical protein
MGEESTAVTVTKKYIPVEEIEKLRQQMTDALAGGTPLSGMDNIFPHPQFKRTLVVHAWGSAEKETIDLRLQCRDKDARVGRHNIDINKFSNSLTAEKGKNAALTQQQEKDQKLIEELTTKLAALKGSSKEVKDFHELEEVSRVEDSPKVEDLPQDAPMRGMPNGDEDEEGDQSEDKEGDQSKTKEGDQSVSKPADNSFTLKTNRKVPEVPPPDLH